MILSEINSPTLALQILGRAMRGIKNGGNKENTIYLTKENYNKLSEYKLLESVVLN
jgi:superfamily II DNA or RNA helicase